MLIRSGLFSSESVAESHPGKLADRISDAVLDAFLKPVEQARVACETLLADTDVVCAGGFKTRRDAAFEEIPALAPTGAVAEEAPRGA
jgi:S-adenosylmethionine synthetase